MSRLRAAVVVVALAGLAGCGDAEPAAPPTVEATAGNQTIDLQPTQFCLDGEGQRYSVTPPIVEVEPDSPITLRVPASVAERGWSVQVYDQDLQTSIGEVDVDPGTEVYSEINSSDIVPAGFYLVVVERGRDECGNLSGAWPVGFLRPGGDLVDGAAPPSAPSG